MSADFLSRVRAEALRRIEEERFEKAVVKMMEDIRREEVMSTQIPLYHAFHEERKVKLREACEAGRIARTAVEIETAISEYALDNITLDDVYAIIDAVDKDYPHKYATSPQGRAVDQRTGLLGHCAPVKLAGPMRPGISFKFQLYLERALGIGTEMAHTKKSYFNNASMAAVN